MDRRPLIIATRRSPLALRQAEAVAAALLAAFPDLETSLLPLNTIGDERRDWSLVQAGGKGLFTKELEEALLDGRADVAVHSAKDLPGEMPSGLALAGCLPREDPRDCLIMREGVRNEELTIATSSPRRRAQLAARFPRAQWTEIRGNVETRLRKVADGEADATVLAMAGLNRLAIAAWPGLNFEPLSLDAMVPAPGKAAIAIQTREGEEERWSEIFQKETTACVRLERLLLRHWDGGCKTPFGALLDGQRVRVFHAKFGLRAAPCGEAPFADWAKDVLGMAKEWDELL